VPDDRKKTVPAETVRLATETRTDDRRIDDQVRRERMGIDDDRKPGDQNMRAGNASEVGEDAPLTHARTGGRPCCRQIRAMAVAAA
jgi:hypothetical protein